ncbi:hypothetical protein MNV84_03551 [Leishmania braziliensis]|nr:hypothetical protein MNV84_03551 [Leishmania braziliensis]
MAEGSRVQVVCTPYTAIVEEYTLFLKAHQIAAQALSSANAIVGSRLSSARKFTRDVNGVPRYPSPAMYSTEENENRNGVDAPTRMEVLELPASLLCAWLRHTEAVAENKDTDVDEDTGDVATRLQSREETWLSVQPALEYASPTYGPVHAVTWLQWEEIKALHNSEQPHQKPPARSMRPCILVQLVLLWFHNGQMYRLTPAELVNVESKTLTARSPPPPPRTASTGPSVSAPSTSLSTRYVTLEYPPGALWPHRIPVPIAEPLLTRQELIELVRATANIRRHHPLRVAYRVWPQAIPPTAAVPAAARSWSSSSAGVSCAAVRVVVAAPTTRAPPLRALESDAAMAEFVRDILTYGCTAVQVVAVRSVRASLEDTNRRRLEAVGSGLSVALQQSYCAEHNTRTVEEKRAVVATNNARSSDAERGITRKDSATQHGSVASVRCAAGVASPSPMAATAERQSDFHTVMPLAIERANEEVEAENSEAFTCAVYQEEASDKLVCAAPAEVGKMAALAEKVSGTSCLGGGGDAALSPSLQSNQLLPQGPPSFQGRDLGASGEDGPQFLPRDALLPSLYEVRTSNNTPPGAAALQVTHGRHLSDEDEFGETWRNAERYAEYVSGEEMGGGVDSQLRSQPQQPESQHRTLQRTRVNDNVQCKTPVEDVKKGEPTTPVRKGSPVQHMEKLIAEDSRSDHRVSHPLHVLYPASSPLTSSADSGDIAAGTAKGATTDNFTTPSPPPCAKSSCSVSATQQQQQQHTTTSSFSSAATPDPATTVFVRYEVDPTIVCVSGPVLQAVLQHLQEVIFQRCCAHLCQDLDAPRPRFHAAHHHHHTGSTPTTKAATNSIDCFSSAVTASSGAATVVGFSNGDRTIRASGLPAVPCAEYILPLYQYTFTRVEEDALERCIAEIMAVYQGLEQLPAKEAEEWIHGTSSPFPLRS